MRYSEVLQHSGSFDEEGPEARRLAAHLVFMLFRAGDLAITPGRAREYRAEEGPAAPDSARPRGLS